MREAWGMGCGKLEVGRGALGVRREAWGMGHWTGGGSTIASVVWIRIRSYSKGGHDCQDV